MIKTTGDGMLAVFGDPAAAVDAALVAQRALRDATWGETGPLHVRMALHAGAAEARDGDYFGPALNRVARILSIGHGGQVICSAVAADLAVTRSRCRSTSMDLGSHRLRDIDRPEQVYQVVVADLPQTFPPLRSLSTRRSNLPVALTSFVGRERELAEVEALIEGHRLVTLIGTGGTGKTRLMLEAAGRLLDAHPDGVWLAELAPLGDPSQIPSEVARALGAPEVPGVPTLETVTAFLAEKDLLLLLDNAEHLVDGVARLAERLLASAPRLRILTTSREALASPGRPCSSCGRCPARPSAVRDRAWPPRRPPASRTRPRPKPSSCSSARRRGRSGVRARRGQRRGGRGDLPSPRRDPARDRARGGAGVGDVGRRHRAAARGPVPTARRRSSDRGPAPADAPRAHRLELGPPDGRRPPSAPAAVGLHRWLDGRRWHADRR